MYKKLLHSSGRASLKEEVIVVNIVPEALPLGLTISLIN
jgi:hypothetical protein